MSATYPAGVFARHRGSRVVVAVVLITVSCLFLALHSTRVYVFARAPKAAGGSLDRQRQKSSAVNANIIALNVIALAGMGSFQVFVASADLNASNAACGVATIFGVLMYNLVNFFTYRLLLSRAILVDVMDSQTRVTNFVWHFLHYFVLPFILLSTVGSILDGKFEWVTEYKGEMVCGDYVPLPIFVVLAIVDIASFILCNRLFVRRLRAVERNGKYRSLAVRSLAMGVLGAMSTGALYAFLIIVDSKEGFLYRYVIFSLLSIDSIVNVTCANMLWKPSSYCKALAEACPGTAQLFRDRGTLSLALLNDQQHPGCAEQKVGGRGSSFSQRHASPPSDDLTTVGTENRGKNRGDTAL